MSGDSMAPDADVELVKDEARITGSVISLKAPLLRTAARGLALDGQDLIITWDVLKAQFPDRDRHRPYEEGHLIQIEGQVEVADVVLVKFERVDPPPVPDYAHDDEFRAPINEDAGGGQEVAGGTGYAGKGAVGSGGPGSIFDYDPPPTVVRRQFSLTERLEELRSLLGVLSSRIDDLEARVLELEQP
jgi:hypothetical protein